MIIPEQMSRRGKIAECLRVVAEMEFTQNKIKADVPSNI